MNKNIVLIGFMGSGKSMVAQALSQRLKRECVATDHLIETREGQSIARIFEKKGQSYFRDLEHQVIEEISQRSEIVIDCGGGVVLNPENLKLLKTNGIVFYLQASLDVIYARIRNESHRPLLLVPDPLRALEQLYQQRLPLYNQADYTIDANDASIEGPIAEILKRI
ncbi:MAG: shikimate kinase [Candidatus Omnitrophica bacterium]|nr:shikimate kinase [Candidatus Omnitrophota bacterium]